MATLKLYDDSWKSFFKEEFQKDYYAKIKHFLAVEKEKNNTILPPRELVFQAFKLTPLPKVKVVILGQDPYHNIGQAHGLSFSVPKEVKMPPSLKNIYKELATDLNITTPSHGNLVHWATQGVLLLNAVLTVNAHEPASHKDAGWENFTDHIIQYISAEKEHIVFLLWGKFAEQKEALIDANKHLILKAAHPSPFSAYRGFFGCQHFSKTNAYLTKHGLKAIDWSS